jgi:radical SAM protein with 4Fe4S-binding SPASM domain
MHDSRRNNLAKTGTFEKVVAGMEKAVKNGIPINLRSVVDKQNVDNLVEMADFLDKKGWLDLPPNLFKTQIGRNYELFECYEMPEHLFTQVEMWSHVAKLMKEFPVLEKFHKPDFMGIRYLMETGEMYIPSFDTCPAGKTEWVFDLYGDIYGCTASCGREDLKLGTYWPEIKKNDEVIQTWKDRNVTNIDKCKECKFDVICGGGCGVIAANKNNGEILSHDCRPIQGIYDVGMNFYAEKIKELENGNLEEEEIAQGCVICGSELIYAEIAQENRCDICGEVFLSNIKCLEGHYVCDSCHKGDLLDQIENLLVRSEETNPIRLAVKVFEMPTMKMNGPEYHSLVPGVLVTAYQNQQKTRDAEKIKESMERGQDIKGGSCGFHGNCGACVGVGIAESVLLGASPGAKEERGKANLATGTALIEISKLGGPLCCKRESITSIKSYMDLTGHYDTEDDFQYVCSQFKDNKSCIQLECPYFPSNQKKRMS